MNLPKLETEHLILEEIGANPNDISDMQRRINCTEVLQYITAPQPYPENGSQDYYNKVKPKMESGEALWWSLRLKSNPEELIGNIEYRHQGGNKWDRGFWISKEFHRGGLMMEAIECTLDYLFEKHPDAVFEFDNLPPNYPSRRMKEKTGCTFTGLEEIKSGPLKGFKKTEMWSLTAAEWEAHKANPSPIRSLQTDRLILKPLHMSFAEDIQKHINDFEIIKYLSRVPWPYPEDGAKSFIERANAEMNAGLMHNWGIFAKENSQECMGLISFTMLEGDWVCGFWIGREFQGKGYMSEADQVATKFIFNQIGASKILIQNAKGNAASHRLQEKLGCKKIGEENIDCYASGDKIEELWELTKEDWLATQGPELG